MLSVLEWEESIGKAWDKFLSKNTSFENVEAQIHFNGISRSLKIFYHLLGGDKGKDIKVTDKRNVKTNRTLLQKVSGYGKAFYLPWQDDNALYLPQSIALLNTKEENTTLYFWLVAMMSQVNVNSSNIVKENKRAVTYLCNRYSGFKSFYDKASNYLIVNIPELSYINDDKSTFSDNACPCFLWIYPTVKSKTTMNEDSQEEEESLERKEEEKTEVLKMKKKANQMDDKKETDGFMAFLPEGLMSILEQVNVDRSEDDSFDEDALYNAQDLDEITLGQKKANLNSRLKMDLDLENAPSKEYPVGKGFFLDEWDYTKKKYLKNFVRIKPIITQNCQPLELPKHLKRTVRKINEELDLMHLDRIKQAKLADGDEINIDTWIDYKGHKNKNSHHQKFFESFEQKSRDMSTLILADISLSTEAGITPELRVIDMVKDGLMVFSEALERLQDQFAIYAFSSNKNTNVRFHLIKNFKERFSKLIRGRIDEMTPGYYTRLGAAIRESAKILEKQKSENRLLLVISDGKPNDIDRYDGRYGIEDTKKAIQEVKQKGMSLFCITIDLEAKDYLTYLFGKNGYALVRDTKNLPKVLPEIYMNLTK